METGDADGSGAAARATSGRHLLRLGVGHRAGADRTDLLGRAVLRLHRLHQADAARSRLVARGADRRILAGAAIARRGRAGGGAMARPAGAAAADELRLLRRRAAAGLLVAGAVAVAVLPDLGGDRPDAGGGALRSCLLGGGDLVRARPGAGADVADLSGWLRLCALYPVGAVPGWSAGLAHGAADAGGAAGSRHDSAARAAAAPPPRRHRPATRWCAVASDRTR
jgi:hypothetical protein